MSPRLSPPAFPEEIALDQTDSSIDQPHASAQDRGHPVRVSMLEQPDDTTCGPTCLQAVYDYFGYRVPLSQLIREVPTLESGGTLSVILGSHALSLGFRATLYTYNLEIFDPTWFKPGAAPLTEMLARRLSVVDIPRVQHAIPAYLRFAEAGGQLKFEELRPALLRRYLERDLPILTGLSATYLYQDIREDPLTCREDSIGGAPVGHFVVLCGWNAAKGEVDIADPSKANPFTASRHYRIGVSKVLGAIMLGVLTYDGNLLIIEPREDS